MNDNRQWDGSGHIRRLMEVDRSELPADGRPRFNRLIFERSPYLLQHAENPVNWYAWGEAAFSAARAEDKPIFLSIGYATCHWCHVMEKESFEDEEVAEVLNRHFIAIKVDREERPDIDDQYMLVSQLMTGSGGWPLNVVMTPERRPFFTATYLPKYRRGGMPGLIEFLENVAKLWTLRRDLVEDNCAAVMDALGKVARTTRGNLPGDEVSDIAFRQVAQLYDAEQGGFGAAPKFPMAGYLDFLLRQKKRTGERFALTMAENTLRVMRDGGIYDQVGDGFHRYAVDRLWIVPHFEKMLYDQALLALVYVDAGKVTGDGAFQEVAVDVLRFMVRDMKAAGGAFYSALDADSEGEEGKFYVWTLSEFAEVLGEDDAALCARIYSASDRGNFEGKNILHVDRMALEAAGRDLGMEALREKLRRGRELLFAERRKRVHPLRDEKVLVAWNGLAIAAAARVFGAGGDAAFMDAAREAAAFIERQLVRKDGRLLRSHLGDAAPVSAFLEDYAFFVKGLIELHQATLDSSWLERAVSLSRAMLEQFGDAEEGGLFDTPADGEIGLLRMKSIHDGVLPSGNAVAADNLIRLGRITGDDSLVAEGEGVIRAFMGTVEKQPVNYLQLLSAGELAGNDQVLTLKGRRNEVETFRREAARRYLPDLVLRFDERDEPATAQLCAVGKCGLPLRTPEELGQELDEI